MILARYIFIALNILRTISIISMTLLVISSIRIVVTDISAVVSYISHHPHTDADDVYYIPRSTIPNAPAGAAWGVINRFFFIFQAGVFLMSECDLRHEFFEKYFPVLGDQFGLAPLGIFQGLLGVAILSHYVDKFSSVCAFLAISVGYVNMIIGFLWGENGKDKRSLEVWKNLKNKNAQILPVAVKGIVPPTVGAVGSGVFGTAHEDEDDQSDEWVDSLDRDDLHSNLRPTLPKATLPPPTDTIRQVTPPAGYDRRPLEVIPARSLEPPSQYQTWAPLPNYPGQALRRSLRRI